jgi:hypothetical protein
MIASVPPAHADDIVDLPLLYLEEFYIRWFEFLTFGNISLINYQKVSATCVAFAPRFLSYLRVKHIVFDMPARLDTRLVAGDHRPFHRHRHYKKALVVLRVNVAALSQRGAAIQLEDCECIGLKVCECVNGASIARDLEEIFNQAGKPKAIIKDGDYTLAKGVRLWSEKQRTEIPVIADIGHSMATALKDQFEKTAAYKHFTALLTQGTNRLRLTELAFLIPPKLRSKGRFQSISALGKWLIKYLTCSLSKAVPKRVVC